MVFSFIASLKRDVTVTLVQRAEQNGYKAIVLTSDSLKIGRREANMKNKTVVPAIKNVEGLWPTKFDQIFTSLVTLSTLQDIGWLKSLTKLPILIKGVLTHEDVGVAGIIVSNHGARQLDYTHATISVLQFYSKMV
ncbi:hypothetical protein GQ457_16G017590 [Hibiscus cannabinus]